jgi:hypothetical protein
MALEHTSFLDGSGKFRKRLRVESAAWLMRVFLDQ